MKIANASTADKQLREQMPAPCEEVTRASDNLLVATTQLSKTPTSPSGRKLLLDAVKGILNGTTGILDVFDDSEVRKILEASKIVRELSVGLSKAPTPESISDYVNRVQRLGQGFIPLCQLATKRCGELTLDILKVQLKEIIDIIVNESPSMVNTCKLFLANPDHQDNKAVVRSFGKRMVYATIQIDRIVQCRDEGGLNAEECGAFQDRLSLRRKLGEELLQNNLNEHFMNPDQSVALKSFQNFTSSSNNLMIPFDDYISMITVNVPKDCAMSVSHNIKINVQGLDDIIKKAPTDHEDPKLIFDTQETLKSVQKGYETIEKLVPKALACGLFNSLAQLEDIRNKDTIVADLYDTALTSHDIDKELDLFQKECLKVDKLVKGTLGLLNKNQQQIYQKIEMQNSGVQSLAEASESAATIMKKLLGDQIATSNLSTIFFNFNNQIKELKKTLLSDDSVFSAGDLLAGAGKFTFVKLEMNYNAIAAQLRDALARNDKEGARTALAALRLAHKHLVKFQ
jgi:hypothetical protein